MLRANKAGAAMVLIVMDIPGNVTTEPEAGMGTAVPTLTISMKEGIAIREAIEVGNDVTLRLRADIERKPGLKTANVWGVLPGMTDENILVMAHTDAMFEGALDNASGIVMLLEIARYYAAIPKEQRRRSITFVTTPDHHHGATGIKWINQNMRDFLDQTALIVNCEHPSQTQTYRLGSGLMTSTTTSASLVRRRQRSAQARSAEFPQTVWRRGLCAPRGAARRRAPARLYAGAEFPRHRPHLLSLRCRYRRSGAGLGHRSGHPRLSEDHRQREQDGD